MAGIVTALLDEKLDDNLTKGWLYPLRVLVYMLLNDPLHLPY